MNREYNNRDFYLSKEWKQVSKAYMMSRHYICERCGKPAVICHHKRYLNGVNVHDPEVALNFANLEALCQECHNQEHTRVMSVATFDSSGNVNGVKKGKEERDFEKEQAKIEELLRRLDRKHSRSANTGKTE